MNAVVRPYEQKTFKDKIMFDKILIANRGEIAARVIRACKELDIATVAVFSEADRDALHVQMADEAVCVGSARARDSYLNVRNIISAAVLTGAKAIHPGFGFLSENSVFASQCEDCGIKFIGPGAEAIRALGDKANAKALAKAAGIPVIPDSGGLVKNYEAAAAFARAAGYPVMIKASAGGGGKGIRAVYSEPELEGAFLTAKSEARAAFSDDGVYMEKMIQNARHIEVQIIADGLGNYIHLGERDCSVQRGNQKLLEEAPASVDEKKRAEMGGCAILAAKKAGYENAGTVEFLVDKNGGFYFMEMNARIQVEHPVTEMITGVDIVNEQIRIAAGLPLSVKQEDVRITGHAIECRINAEAPRRNFAPCAGKINYLLLPAGGLGLRVESALYAGYDVPPYYDSMLAKVITHGKTRDEAIRKMRRALGEFVINGVETNIDFQLEMLNDEDFIERNVDTGFVARMINK